MDLSALITVLTGTSAVGIAIAATILIAVLNGGAQGDRARQVLRILRLGPSGSSDSPDSPSSPDKP